MISYTKVTVENIEDARNLCVACDQREELQPGDETWGVIGENGQRGQMSRYTRTGRGAVCFGGDSLWGDWQTTGDLTLLVLDGDETAVDEEGNMMSRADMREAFRALLIEAN